MPKHNRWRHHHCALLLTHQICPGEFLCHKVPTSAQSHIVFPNSSWIVKSVLIKIPLFLRQLQSFRTKSGPTESLLGSQVPYFYIAVLIPNLLIRIMANNIPGQQEICHPMISVFCQTVSNFIIPIQISFEKFDVQCGIGIESQTFNPPDILFFKYLLPNIYEPVFCLKFIQANDFQTVGSQKYLSTIMTDGLRHIMRSSPYFAYVIAQYMFHGFASA